MLRRICLLSLRITIGICITLFGDIIIVVSYCLVSNAKPQSINIHTRISQRFCKFNHAKVVYSSTIDQIKMIVTGCLCDPFASRYLCVELVFHHEDDELLKDSQSASSGYTC